MEQEIQALLDAFADLRDRANVNAVFGEPVTTEGRTVIPVARVMYGFGMGVGHATAAEKDAGEAAVDIEEGEEGAGSGGGGGGGVMAHPLAIVEVTPQGARVKPIVDEQRLALAGGLLAGWVVLCLAWAAARIFGGKRDRLT